MDLRRRLQTIHDRVQLSARELELQPETFQATEELKQAAGDLAAVLAELADPNESQTDRGGVEVSRSTGSISAPPRLLFPLRPTDTHFSVYGTDQAPSRPLPKAA
jgi:hypothetical protein